LLARVYSKGTVSNDWLSLARSLLIPFSAAIYFPFIVYSFDFVHIYILLEYWLIYVCLAPHQLYINYVLASAWLLIVLLICSQLGHANVDQHWRTIYLFNHTVNFRYLQIILGRRKFTLQIDWLDVSVTHFRLFTCILKEYHFKH
jgi:hypothetical protein